MSRRPIEWGSISAIQLLHDVHQFEPLALAGRSIGSLCNCLRPTGLSAIAEARLQTASGAATATAATIASALNEMSIVVSLG